MCENADKMGLLALLFINNVFGDDVLAIKRFGG